MKGTGRIGILVLTALIMINTAPLQKDHAVGQAAPDFDIEVSTTNIFLHSDNGFLDSFTVQVINQCLHSLNIQVTTNCPGATVSPATATVTVGPGATTDVHIAVGSSSSTPAGLAIAGVHAEIVQVDGVPLSGKSRYADVLVQFQRYSQITMITSKIEVEKGAANARNIKFQNMGNFLDHFSLELQDGDPITGSPLMDVLSAGPGEEVLYPVIITVPEKTSETSIKIRYRIWSLVNPGTQVNGTITLNIRENSGSSEEQVMVQPSQFMIITGGSCIFLIFLAVHFQRSRDGSGIPIMPQRSKIRGSMIRVIHQLRSNVSYLPLPWSINDNTSSRVGSRILPVVISAMIFGGSIIVFIPFTSEAQVTPDCTVTISPGILHVEPSPFTPDDAAISTCEVTLTSQSSMETVVQCTIEGGFAGYAHEQRIPPGGQVSFEVACGVQKETKAEQYMYVLTAVVIEVNGVPIDTGTSSSTGFNLNTLCYSFPIIIPQKGAVQTTTDGPMSITFVVINNGNRFEEIDIFSPERTDLEPKTFTFTGFPDSVGLDPGDSEVLEIDVTSEKDPDREFTILTIRLTPEMDENRTASCTIVFASNVSGDGDGDEDFIPGIGPAIILLAILFAGIVWERRIRNHGE